MRHCLLVVGLWALPLGCGNGSDATAQPSNGGSGGSTGTGGSSSGGQPGTSVSVGEFAGRYADAFCQLLARCCEVSSGTTQGTCEADLQAEVEGRNTEAAADGAVWNGAAAGSCLDAIAAADCEGANVAALRALLDSCSDTWNGVIPPGGPCQNYESCAEPQVSGGASAGASCVNGMCVQVVRLPVGANCTDSDPQQGCDPFLAECVAGACQALPDVGETCTDSCIAGARCTDGMCEALLGVGETCTVDSDCATDQCSGGKCASSLVEGEYCALP